MPYVNEAGADQDGEQARGRHLHILRTKQDFAALNAIGYDSADQRKKKNRNAAEKLVKRQKERRVAQAIDEPALGYDLHPCADAGRAGADPHQAKITILKCLKDPADHSDVLIGPRKSLP